MLRHIAFANTNKKSKIKSNSKISIVFNIIIYIYNT